MNPHLEFLRQHALRRHEAVYHATGPSHGDAGGDMVFQEHLSCQSIQEVMVPILHNSDTLVHKVLELKPSGKPCTCGADAHNAKVEQAVQWIEEHLDERTDHDV